MRLGLVLGAGGVAGMNYHAGVLHALTEVGGLDPAGADLIVGTSAGSVMGSLLRSGWTPNDCWELALGIHPDVISLEDDEVERRARAVFAPRFTNPLDLARAAIGSSYVIGRSLVRTPLPPVHPLVARELAKRFPGGIFSTAEAETRFAEILPEAWPEKPLWLVAVDIGSGRRVVLGRRGSPLVSLHEGVLASCAIPGVYSPVRAGGFTMVDGGAHSTTNLDLAVRAGCSTVIGVAPMAYDPASPPGSLTQLERRRATRSLAAEARVARGKGTDVLLIRPTAPELVIHGRRAMRPADGAAIALAAFDATARLLDTPRSRDVLEGLAAA